MTLGITVGKFYPFHQGHHHLIESAKQQVDLLVVLACWKPGDSISGKLRADWIRELHPDVEVIEVLDDLPEAPEPWAKRALKVLQGRRPDIAFSSEEYGEPWAKFMGAWHVCVDLDRDRFPISGTQLRGDLATHWQMLTPPVKAHFAKRVCILGVESSGTTTLATDLARHYQTVFVPEYGRFYHEGKQYASNLSQWDSYEFVQIAQGQILWEEHLARRANRLVVCDTDPLATLIWHRRYMGCTHTGLEQIASERMYDCYFLTQPDFDFVQDGTRDGEHIRHEMHKWFLEALQTYQRTFHVVSGSPEERLKFATAKIDELLHFETLITT